MKLLLYIIIIYIYNNNNNNIKMVRNNRNRKTGESNEQCIVSKKGQEDTTNNYIKSLFTKSQLPQKVSIKPPPGAGIKAVSKNYDNKIISDMKFDDNFDDDVINNLSYYEYWAYMLEIDEDILQRYEAVYQNSVGISGLLGQINYDWVNELIEMRDFDEMLENDDRIEDEDDDTKEEDYV